MESGFTGLTIELAFCLLRFAFGNVRGEHQRNVKLVGGNLGGSQARMNFVFGAIFADKLHKAEGRNIRGPRITELCNERIIGHVAGQVDAKFTQLFSPFRLKRLAKLNNEQAIGRRGRW